MKIRPGTDWATAPRTSPSCDTWRSTSCKRTQPRDLCAGSSSAPAGTTPTSPVCSPYSEVRLPCRLRGNPKKPLANQFRRDSSPCMIRAGFLDPESRRDLIDPGRDGSVAHRPARRANALVLLDDGMSCGDVAKVLLLDDDTVRTWYRLYQDEGIEGLASFGHDGSACRLSDAQQDKLKSWIAETLPRTTREVGAWIETECGITYESRSGLIALLHRLEMEHRKPKAVSSKLDPDKQAAFIKSYDTLLVKSLPIPTPFSRPIVTPHWRRPGAYPRHA